MVYMNVIKHIVTWKMTRASFFALVSRAIFTVRSMNFSKNSCYTHAKYKKTSINTKNIWNFVEFQNNCEKNALVTAFRQMLKSWLRRKPSRKTCLCLGIAYLILTTIPVARVVFCWCTRAKNLEKWLYLNLVKKLGFI